MIKFDEPWIMAWNPIIGYLRRYMILQERYSEAVMQIQRWERSVGLPLYYTPTNTPYLIPSVFKEWWLRTHIYQVEYRKKKVGNKRNYIKAGRRERLRATAIAFLLSLNDQQ